MTKLILSTSNIMGGGPSVIRRPTNQKSNTEFISALRANFTSAQHEANHNKRHEHEANGDASKSNGLTNGSLHHPSQGPPPSAWTSTEEDSLYIPTWDASRSGLAEERSQYEITVKLFFLPNKPASCRCAQTREAIKFVLQELHVPSIDLLIVSFPGIAFDAEDDEDGEEHEDAHSDGEAALRADASAEDIDTQIETWACLEQLHDEGVIGRLGLSEFGKDRLSKFLRKARIRPSVDQINVRDCCVVPKPLILYAKQEEVELLTHSDCTNILSRGAVRELLGQSEGGARLLAADNGGEGLKGEVEPQWVIKYTAVVKDRGVIENKGYFAVAETHDE